MQLAKTIAFASAAVVASVAVVAADCNTPAWGSCGNSQAATCCPDNQYCQPWNANYYQCRTAPAQCAEQHTDIDFYGNDLTAIYGIQPDECCSKCASTPGCKAYTFVNDQPGSPGCYLKSGVGEWRNKKGAVSAVVTSNPPPPTVAPTTAPPTSGPTPTPTPTASGDCSTPQYGNCGNSAGTKCCPSNSYCQPWNSGYYQCLPAPAKCSKQYTDIDFYGNDIQTVYGLQPNDCCDKCAQTQGCKAYTFVNDNPGRTACYLKSGQGEWHNTKGAVSGILN